MSAGDPFHTSYGRLDTVRASLFFGMVTSETFYILNIEWDKVDADLKLGGGHAQIDAVAGGLSSREILTSSTPSSGPSEIRRKISAFCEEGRLSDIF